MAKLAYLDCPTGISGDMCLGALVDAGVPLDYLIENLARLGMSQEYRLRAELVQHNAQQATKVYVDLLETDRHGLHHRHFPDIEDLIAHAQLPERVRHNALSIFRALAVAEGIVHGIPPEKVHFHEVGAIDAIVDIVGTCLGLDWLGIDRLYCSALPVGGGTIRAAHGLLPVPAPAVLKLWESRQVPIYSNGILRELVTPTGAAIAVALVEAFGAIPAMRLEKVGLGAGSIELPIPNILRLWIAQQEETQPSQGSVATAKENDRPHDRSHSHRHQASSQPKETSNLNLGKDVSCQTFLETVAVLATQIDDSSPQAIGYLFEVLFQLGALDVFTQAIGMKKCRPGILLTAICPPDKVEVCEAAIFRETTTLGIRRSLLERSILSREFDAIATPYGEVLVKVARDRSGTLLNVQPEYEDCAQRARQHGKAWQDIRHVALQTWYDRQSREMGKG